MNDRNAWILEESSNTDLWAYLEEHIARLNSYCRERPINVKEAMNSALSIKAIETELTKRGIDV